METTACIKVNGLMNYNTDGFNERNIYIHNANDANRLASRKPVNYDNSLSTFKINENKPDIKTSEGKVLNTSKSVSEKDFLLRNININNVRNKRGF